MNIKTLIAVGLVATSVTGGIVATTASGSPKLETLVLTGTTLKQVQGKTTEEEADLLKEDGKNYGFATESCNFGGTKDKCAVTFALKDGMLYGTVTFPITSGSSAQTVSGKITGGAGIYKGSTGSIKLKTKGKTGLYTLQFDS